MEVHIIENLRSILERIGQACERCGRNPEEVRLVLATKTVNPENIKIALANGGFMIAENKIQELKEKYEALKTTKHLNHFIGHLQTNKIKEVLKYDVSCIESVDRLELAEKLQKRLEFEDKYIDVLIQVNTSQEESKFGISPEETLSLIKKISTLNRIRVKGLMTIGLLSAEAERVRPCFRLLKKLQQKILAERIPNIEMRKLSMGMSGDFETAIEEGATLVRIGTAVFGKRIYPDSYYWDEGK